MARQATQIEAADARKRKRTKEVRWKQEKEQEIARRVKAGERKSDAESELESEDPTDVDDMVFSEEEESRKVIVTSAECRDPTAMSAGDEQEAERRLVVPVPRKRAVRADAVDEWEAKQMRSPHPSVASPVSSPPAVDAAEQAGRSEEPSCTRVSPGLALASDL